MSGRGGGGGGGGEVGSLNRKVEGRKELVLMSLFTGNGFFQLQTPHLLSLSTFSHA